MDDKEANMQSDSDDTSQLLRDAGNGSDAMRMENNPMAQSSTLGSVSYDNVGSEIQSFERGDTDPQDTAHSTPMSKGVCPILYPSHLQRQPTSFSAASRPSSYVMNVRRFYTIFFIFYNNSFR